MSEAPARAYARWGVPRGHWLFLLVLAAGVALRVVTQLSYVPAVLYFDSSRYLSNVGMLRADGYAPLGYTVFLRVVLTITHDLTAVVVLQHLLGIGLGVLVYVTMLRRGVRPLLAAVAAAPVLLDAYQMFLEQMIMSETLFELFLVLGVVALTWWRRPPLPAIVVAGACFAGAGLTRYVGLLTFVVGVLFLLLAGLTWKRRLLEAGVLLLAAVVPLALYAGYNDYRSGQFTISSHTDARALYGRVATFVDCDQVNLPDHELQLCPVPGAVQPKRGSLLEGYMFDPNSPWRLAKPPPGISRRDMMRDFSRRVILAQPLDMSREVSSDFVRPLTSWRPQRHDGELPIDRWRFVEHYPRKTLRAAFLADKWGGHEVSANAALALFMRRYQLSIGYAPGLLLGGCILLALLAGLGVTRAARASGLRTVALLWAAVPLVAYASAIVFEFSWRYFFPVLPLLPVAGAFGLTALTGWRAQGRESAEGVAARTRRQD